MSEQKMSETDIENEKGTENKENEAEMEIEKGIEKKEKEAETENKEKGAETDNKEKEAKTNDKNKSLYRPDPDAIWTETVKNEIKSVNKWQAEWGFLVDSYKKLQRDAASVGVITKKGEKKVLEERILRSYPKTTAQEIGWLSAQRGQSLETLFGCERPKPVRTLYKAFGWPREGCP